MIRPTSPANEVVVDRRRAGRRDNDRRRTASSVASSQAEHRPAEARASEPAEQRRPDRRKVERRRQIDPTTCERDYTPDQVDFMKAMDLYKRRSGRQFPTWSEVLEVLENLGYRKVATPTDIYKRVEQQD
ncbi:MAG TPA: hypothetical protein VGP63_23290 [Planctomycetaceae bacterium]|jgi:hypothetical protein|nr:hypothetical protein [Planctomycetaceae bacterium]